MNESPPRNTNCDGHILVDDYSQGVRVCIVCGYVFSVQLFGEDNSTSAAATTTCPPKVPSMFAQRNRFISEVPYELIIREFLFDSMAPINMDTGFLVDKVLRDLHLASKKKERYSRLSLRNETDRGRLAFLVWNAMQEERCPRPPADIACLLQSTTVAMRAAEKELHFQPGYAPLAAYVSRLANELMLPQWIITAVEDACWHCGSETMTVPEQFIGAMLLHVGIMFGKGIVGLTHLLTVEKIASVVGCEPSRLNYLRDCMGTATRRTLLEKVYRQAIKSKVPISSLGCDVAYHQAAEYKKKCEK